MQMEARGPIDRQQIRRKISADPDFIKKSRINYFDCQCKGLHEGEKLVLVCLQNTCQNKGLICPVCREESHKKHQVMHLKIFLGELQAKLVQREAGESAEEGKQATSRGKTLSDYLTLLQNAKKNMIVNLHESVKTLAQAVKEVEKKIQDEYVRIRRLILSQRSFQSKLPGLYQTLLDESVTEPTQKQRAQIQQQIKKLTELLQKSPKENKAVVANSVDNIVDLYIKNSDTCTTHLLTLMTELPSKFSDLPIRLKSIVQDLEGKQSKNQKVQYKFSEAHKANSVLLSEDRKEASLLTDEISGMVFVKVDNPEPQLRHLNLKITSSISDSISIGVGSIDKMYQNSFIIHDMQSSQLFGICGMGISLSDMDTPSFVFSSGDVIEVTFDVKQGKLSFGRRNGMEKFEVLLGLGEEQCRKMQFFVNLLICGDCVEIVE